MIEDSLIRLTHNQLNWGFVLRYLYLRNVKAFKLGDYSIYRKTSVPLAGEIYFINGYLKC
jgi:hypothetical protein